MNDEAFLTDHQMFHSEFQMDYLITVRAGGTPYGCYKQALREWFKRWRGVKAAKYELELLKLKIKSAELKEPKTEIGKARKALKVEHLRDGLPVAEFSLAETQRELDHFRGQCEKLRKVVGELTPERRRQLDEEMFEYRALAAAALDLYCLGGLQRNNAEMIQAFPNEMRSRVCAALKKPGKLIDLYMNHSSESESLPALVAHAEDHPVCKSRGGICGKREECHAGEVCGEADGVPGLPSSGGN